MSALMDASGEYRDPFPFCFLYPQLLPALFTKFGGV